jgi:hypothetical protein
MEIFNEGDFVYDKEYNIYMICGVIEVSGETIYKKIYIECGISDNCNIKYIDEDISLTYLHFQPNEKVYVCDNSDPTNQILKTISAYNEPNYTFTDNTSISRFNVIKVPPLSDSTPTISYKKESGLSVEWNNRTIIDMIGTADITILFRNYYYSMKTKLDIQIVRIDMLLAKLNTTTSILDNCTGHYIEEKIQSIKQIYNLELNDDSFENKITLVSAVDWLIRNTYSNS